MPRDVLIHAETARAFFTPQARWSLFDPERPKADPNELLKELGGMVDPRTVNHNCPLCNRTMQWDLFQAHALLCVMRWGHMLDPTLKKFTGVDLPERKDVTVSSVPASASGS